MSTVTSKKILILGLPNTGKTQIFNNLTGTYGIVSNYPMTTLQAQKAVVKTLPEEYTIIDAPGFHSLFIQSEEELEVRRLLLSEKPDIILHCIDANRLKQSLFLTFDLMELGVPMVVSLNAIDETDAKGMYIDEKELSKALGVPVVKTAATEGRGTAELISALKNTAVPSLPCNYPEKIEEMLEALSGRVSIELPYRRKILLLLLLQDSFLTWEWLSEKEERENLKSTVTNLLKDYNGNIHYAVSRTKNRWVSEVASKTIKKQGVFSDRFSEGMARLSRNPATGFPLLFFFLLLSYFIVVHVAGFLEEVLTSLISDPIVSFIDRIISDGWIKDFLIGDYGILTLGLFNAIFTVLPVLSVFFLLFGLLEDMGYLPNLSILVRRLFNKIGLSGKAIMPIILGFGCKTMATLTTRSIASKKERTIAIFLIAFGIPCSAQMGLNMAILGNAGVASFVIALGFLFFVELVAGALLNKLIKDDASGSFILELPPFRIPNLYAVLKKTYYRLFWFLRESIVIFIIAAVGLFVFDTLGGLDFLKRFLHPVIVNWLGLPVDMVEALILTMARHEIAAGFILNLSNAGRLSFIQSIISVVITTMFVPCIANIVAIFKELGAKTGLVMVLSINLVSFLLAGILNWTLILFLGS